MHGTEPKKRSLRPKEHGAYGQLGLPLAAALAMGSPGAASVCLVIASVALFFAHEPVLVVVGARGARAKSEHGKRAFRVGLVQVIVALVTGSAGVWLGGEAVLRAVLPPAVLVFVLVPIVLSGAEKTLGGEIVVAFALAGAALPVAVAAGVPFASALAVWCAWSAAFTATTAAVHWVLATHKGRRDIGKVAVAGAATATAIALGWATQSWVPITGWPMLLVSWGLIARTPHARHLRRVGWTLMTSGMLTAVMIATAIRSGA